MKDFVDISFFLDLQNKDCSQAFVWNETDLSNGSVKAIDRLVSDVMDQIEVLRELNADEIAEAEQVKIEKETSNTQKRLEIILDAIRQQTASVKRSGVYEDQESDENVAEIGNELLDVVQEGDFEENTESEQPTTRKEQQA